MSCFLLFFLLLLRPALFPPYHKSPLVDRFPLHLSVFGTGSTGIPLKNFHSVVASGNCFRSTVVATTVLQPFAHRPDSDFHPPEPV